MYNMLPLSSLGKYFVCNLHSHTYVLYIAAGLLEVRTRAYYYIESTRA